MSTYLFRRRQVQPFRTGEDTEERIVEQVNGGDAGDEERAMGRSALEQRVFCARHRRHGNVRSLASRHTTFESWSLSLCNGDQVGFPQR